MTKKVIYGEDDKIKIELFDSIEEMKSPINYDVPTKEQFEAKLAAAKSTSLHFYIKLQQKTRQVIIKIHEMLIL